MVGGVVDCYSKTENSGQLEKSTQVATRTVGQIGVPAVTRNQEFASEEYHGNIKSIWDIREYKPQWHYADRTESRHARYLIQEAITYILGSGIIVVKLESF